MSETPYSRVYWSIRDDERFAGIYGHDACLATWLRLLIAADAVWPHPADLPASARPKPVAALAEAGVIDLLPGKMYRIHGLDAERGRRQGIARANASTRWALSGSDRNATALQEQSDTNASRAEPSRDEPRQWPADANASADAWFAIGKRRLPTTAQMAVVADYLGAFDQTGDERLAALWLANPADPIGAMLDDLKAFRSERRTAAVAVERDAKQAKRSSSTVLNDPLLRQIAAGLAARDG